VLRTRFLHIWVVFLSVSLLWLHWCLWDIVGCSLDCSSTSDAMDWIAFDVWMGNHSFLGCIFVCIVGCSLDCSSASDVMDWIAFDVRMGNHNFLYIIWRLYPFDLSVGKTSRITSSIILVTTWVWLWFRKTYVLKSKTSFVVVFHLIVMVRYFFLYINWIYIIYIYRSSAIDIILWCCYMVLCFRDGLVGHCLHRCLVFLELLPCF